MPPLGYIEGLCIALEHQWKPDGLFVIFTAYFDEADTHGPNPTVIMSCFWGHAYQWRRFEKRLADACRRHRFAIFHAKDFKARSGEFLGWSDGQCDDLVTELNSIVFSTLGEGITIALRRHDYLNRYRSKMSSKLPIDSQYGLCFRALLISVVSRVIRIGRNPKLHVVVEDGHVNVGDALRIFGELRTRHERRGEHVLGGITVARKETEPSLMVADFLAAAHSMIRDQDIALATPDANSEPTKPVGHRRGINVIEIPPDGFDEFRQQAWDARTEMLADRAKRKRARQNV